MRLLLEEDLARCHTLPEVQTQTQITLRDLRSDGYEIHYVAGPISCDGEAKIPENIDKLISARTQLMQQLGKGALVFTAPFIFSLEDTHNTYSRLGLLDMPKLSRESTLRSFWATLISSGLLDGIHFVRGYERSEGAVSEHAAAITHQVPIYYCS